MVALNVEIDLVDGAELAEQFRQAARREDGAVCAQKIALVAAPSIRMVWPETKLARAEPRKTTTLASSSGMP